jgi:BirA family biotin operon repressor/biotin-[acetyl-CoA-carboxylase] ligase
VFDILAVKALLADTRFDDVHLVQETGSTNDDIMPILAENRKRPYTIVAEHQSNGRGRKNREWLSESGTSIMWTTSLPPIRVEDVWAVTFWVALRVAEGIAEASRVAVNLQWPNDILLDGRKLAGILCVSRISNGMAYVGCGAGINFYRPSAPLKLEQPAAFLNDYAATTREQVLACILNGFNETFEDLDSPETIARQWERFSRISGTPYRILVDGESESFDVVAKGLDEQGGLIVYRGTEERTIRAGDARVLR